VRAEYISRHEFSGFLDVPADSENQTLQVWCGYVCNSGNFCYIVTFDKTVIGDCLSSAVMCSTERNVQYRGFIIIHADSSHEDNIFIVVCLFFRMISQKLMRLGSPDFMYQ